MLSQLNNLPFKNQLPFQLPPNKFSIGQTFPKFSDIKPYENSTKKFDVINPFAGIENISIKPLEILAGQQTKLSETTGTLTQDIANLSTQTTQQKEMVEGTQTFTKLISEFSTPVDTAKTSVKNLGESSTKAIAPIGRLGTQAGNVAASLNTVSMNMADWKPPIPNIQTYTIGIPAGQTYSPDGKPSPGGSILNTILPPYKASGGYVQSDGLVFIHKGENIVPADVTSRYEGIRGLADLKNYNLSNNQVQTSIADFNSLKNLLTENIQNQTSFINNSDLFNKADNFLQTKENNFTENTRNYASIVNNFNSPEGVNNFLNNREVKTNFNNLGSTVKNSFANTVSEFTHILTSEKRLNSQENNETTSLLNINSSSKNSETSNIANEFTNILTENNKTSAVNNFSPSNSLNNSTNQLTANDLQNNAEHFRSAVNNSFANSVNQFTSFISSTKQNIERKTISRPAISNSSKTTNTIGGFIHLLTKIKENKSSKRTEKPESLVSTATAAVAGVSLTYAPTINLSGNTATAKQNIDGILKKHSTEIEAKLMSMLAGRAADSEREFTRRILRGRDRA